MLRQFRELTALLGDASKAFHAWFVVWQDLFFRAQEGGSVGRLPATGVPALMQSLMAIFPEEEKCRQALLTILQVDGEDYVSPRFILLNAYIGRPSLSSMGGSAKSYLSRQKRVSAEALQQGLLISPNKFIDDAGNPLNGEECRRIVRLIRSCDNALFQSERKPEGFSDGLIAEARRVLQQFDDEQINQICLNVSRRRGHVILEGMVTEKLLPDFGGITSKLN